MSIDPIDAALAAAKAKHSPEQHERAQKDSLRGLIAAKREVSYVQLALDLRRSQTAQLGSSAAHRASTLKQAEEVLAADIAKFETFLKTNDEEVQAAEDASDLQCKIRQDKVVELKTQNGILAGIKSEVNKLEDALEECAVYKTFLENLTPLAWLQELKENRTAARAARLEAWQESCNAVLAERSAAAEAVAVQEYAQANARSQQQFDRATIALGTAQTRSQLACATQKPLIPDTPEAEVAEPNYFTKTAALSQELHKMKVANAALHEQLQTARKARTAAKAAADMAQAELSNEGDRLGIEFARLQAEAAGARRASKQLLTVTRASNGTSRRTSTGQEAKPQHSSNQRSSDAGGMPTSREYPRGMAGKRK